LQLGLKTMAASREIRRSTFLRLLGFLRPYWKGAALASLLSLAAAVCAIGLLGTSAYLLSAAALRPSVAVLQVAIVGVRFFGLGRGVFRYLERWGSHEINFRVLAGMRGWFYRRLEPLAPARLLETASGDLLGRAIADISTLEEFYLRGLSPAIVAALTAGGMWLFWRSTSPPLANTFAIFSLLAGLALPLVGRWMARRPAKEEVQARAGLGAALVDSLQGLAELAACNRAEAAIDRLKTLDKTYARAQRRSAGILAWQAGLSSLVVNLAGWTMLTLGIAGVESGHLPGLLLAAILMSTQAAMEAVLPLPQAAYHLEKSLQSARRLFTLIDRPPEVPEAAPSTEKEQPAAPHTAPPPYPPLPGAALNIRGLSFSYGPDLPLVFDGLDFALLPGERVGLVGPSGVGKTTLANLLLRFWDFQAGEIELHGQSIRQYSPQEIHAWVAVLPTRPYLFSTTLRQNLLLANPSATADQLTSALNQACLGEWVSTLPEGLDTWIGEHGLRLSAGERQRLALARFFVQDAPLVVLDEPFANLDAVSVSAVWQAVLDHTRGRTLLVITHRLQGMEALDRIAVLRGGRIVEHGRPADLLARDGYYRRMWVLQHERLVGGLDQG
jgi:ATP-binding cassette subfamily C protein CydC